MNKVRQQKCIAGFLCWLVLVTTTAGMVLSSMGCGNGLVPAIVGGFVAGASGQTDGQDGVNCWEWAEFPECDLNEDGECDVLDCIVSGDDGIDGTDGVDGVDGVDGEDGQDAPQASVADDDGHNHPDLPNHPEHGPTDNPGQSGDPHGGNG